MWGSPRKRINVGYFYQLIFISSMTYLFFPHKKTPAVSGCFHLSKKLDQRIAAGAGAGEGWDETVTGVTGT
jgi:hypothetical protein